MNNVWARCFSYFLENDLSKIDKFLGLTFFRARKDYSPWFQRIIVKYPYSSRPKQTHTHIHTHTPPPGFPVPEPCHFTYMPSLLLRSWPFRCNKDYDNNKLDDLLLGRHFKILLQDAYYLGYFRATAWDDPDALSNQIFHVWKLLEYFTATAWNDLAGVICPQLIEVWKSSIRLFNPMRQFDKIRRATYRHFKENPSKVPVIRLK